MWASLSCDAEALVIASAQVFHMGCDYLDDVNLFTNLCGVDVSFAALEYFAFSHRPESNKIRSAELISDAVV